MRMSPEKSKAEGRRGKKMKRTYVFSFNSPRVLLLQRVCPFTLEFTLILDFETLHAFCGKEFCSTRTGLRSSSLQCAHFGLNLGKQAAATPVEPHPHRALQSVHHQWIRELLVSQK